MWIFSPAIRYWRFYLTVRVLSMPHSPYYILGEYMTLSCLPSIVYVNVRWILESVSLICLSRAWLPPALFEPRHRRKCKHRYFGILRQLFFIYPVSDLGNGRWGIKIYFRYSHNFPSSVCCTTQRPRVGMFRHIQSITCNELERKSCKIQLFSSISSTRSPSIGLTGCNWYYSPQILNWRFYQTVCLFSILVAPTTTIFRGEVHDPLMPSLHLCMHVCGECWRVLLICLSKAGLPPPRYCAWPQKTKQTQIICKSPPVPYLLWVKD